MTILPQELRRILGQYPTGVCVVTGTCADGQPCGLVVGSFTPVSLDPPLVAFCPQKGSASWARLAARDGFCVNVLAEDQEAVCRQIFASRGQRFENIAMHQSGAGYPVISNALAYINCRHHAVHEAGDHLIVLGIVTEIATLRAARPLIFLGGAYGRFHDAEPAAA